jgi:NADPH2:quinone reductase
LKVAAVGLNFADLLMAEGKYQEHPTLPFIPGMEFAGTVDALHPATPTTLKPGTRVAGFASHGALAEYITAPAAQLIALPDSMSFQQAAGFQIAYGTSHLALAHKARLQPGETLLVFGAAGGVGLTAVEIGKRMGAQVIACARGSEKLAIARAAGADILIDSDTPDLKAALKAAAKPWGGVDVVYDPVGGPAFSAALSACRPEGRLLTIGFASGQVPDIPANHLLVKNLSVMGLYWGGYLTFAPHVLTDSLRTLFQWFAEGGLRPHISHELAFADYPKGLELLRSRQATGKVVITL